MRLGALARAFSSSLCSQWIVNLKQFMNFSRKRPTECSSAFHIPFIKLDAKKSILLPRRRKGRLPSIQHIHSDVSFVFDKETTVGQFFQQSDGVGCRGFAGMASRRQFLYAGWLGGAGLSLGNLLQLEALGKDQGKPAAKAASRVSSRALASNDAGTVSTTC